MRTASSEFLFIVALTPLSLGAGGGLETIDLPVQKDRLTGFPILRGSQLKGALSQLLFDVQGSSPMWEQLKNLIFGYTSKSGGKAGAIDILDAHVLFFPIASLYGGYSYVTCPYLLHRFADRIRTLSPEVAELSQKLATLACFDDRNGRAIVVETQSKVVSRIKDGEEFAILNPLVKFTAERIKLLDDLVRALSSQGLNPPHPPISGHASIVNDDAAAYLIRHSMIYQPRVRLDYESKTVELGPWIEEAVPRYTIFHTVMFIGPVPRLELEVPGEIIRSVVETTQGADFQFTIKREGDRRLISLDPSTLVNLLFPESERPMFVGGDSTIGRGLVRVIRWAKR